MTRTRVLQNPAGKTWGTRCEGPDVIVRTGVHTDYGWASLYIVGAPAA